MLKVSKQNIYAPFKYYGLPFLVENFLTKQNKKLKLKYERNKYIKHVIHRLKYCINVGILYLKK